VKIRLRLNDKPALVCGSSAGIGLECARSLADLGASVTLCARSEADLDTALASLSGSGHSRIVLTLMSPINSPRWFDPMSIR